MKNLSNWIKINSRLDLPNENEYVIVSGCKLRSTKRNYHICKIHLKEYTYVKDFRWITSEGTVIKDVYFYHGIPKCNKKTFSSLEDANGRAKTINEENRLKNNSVELRGYKCDICNSFHLTHLKKEEYKYNKNRNKINECINESKFIEKESEYWEDYYNKKK